MLRLSRRLIFILVLVLLISCNAELDKRADNIEQIKDETDYSLKGRAVYGPGEIYSGVLNPIEIKEIIVANTEDQHYNYVQISGLKDKVVEERINRDIKKRFDELMNYTEFKKPMPFRGAQIFMQEDTKVYGANLSIYTAFNYNNVLSLVAYVSINLENPLNGYKYMYMTDSLNFDLNTGEQFSLEDVFVNDVDALEIVNRGIYEDINSLKGFHHVDGFSYYDLVSPFKGIKHGQRFFLTPNGINIVIDYNNPEFNVDFASTVMEIPYSSCRGSIAITERFYNEDVNLYTVEATEKCLFVSYSGKRKYEYYNSDNANTFWDASIGYPEDLSEHLLEEIKAHRFKQEAYVLDSANAEALNYVEQRINVQQAGRYLNVSCHVYFNSSNEYQWQEDYYVYSENGELLSIKDIFAADYDYLPIIREGLEKAIKEYRLTDGPEADALLQELNFGIYDTYITFITKPYEWRTGSKHPISFQIQYKDIGYDNLLVF